MGVFDLSYFFMVSFFSIHSKRRLQSEAHG